MSTMVFSPTVAPQVRRPVQATPGRQRVFAVRRQAMACAVARPAPRDWTLRLKVAGVVALSLLGSAVSVAEFASWTAADSTVGVVQGDPAWAHVTGR